MTRLVLLLLLALTARPLLSAPVPASSFRTAAHPRVYFTAADLPSLRAKAEKTPWAAAIVKGWHKNVDAHVARQAEDPSYAPSRLQLNWGEGRHYTDFTTEGNFVTGRSGNAPEPTIRVAYARSAATGNCGLSRDWGKNPPYWDGDMRETGMICELINETMLEHAYQAAILYALEGDERYAKFAADILAPLVRGGAQQREINPDMKGGNHGFLSWETLGDTRRYWAVPLIWDILYDFLHKTYFRTNDFRRAYEIFSKKMIENKLTRGGGLVGNWNLNEQQSAMLYALALDDDAAYADRKGRGYYVGKLLYGPTDDHHGAYVDVLRANIELATGMWPEAPAGYGQGSIAQLVKFGFIYWKNGLDLLTRDPLLQKASEAMPQLVFPNGYIANVGDSSYHKIWNEPVDLMLSYSVAKKDKAMFLRFASVMKLLQREAKNDIAFFFYLPEIPEVETPSLSRVSYAPCYPTVLERNFAPSKDPLDDLAFALSGFAKEMGHRHANGLTLELCGRGEVFAPDIGSGADYWCRETHEYYRHVAAHNTVAPCGSGADERFPMTFETLAGEPAVKTGAFVADGKSPLRQWVKVASRFHGKGGLESPQERLVAIVRTTKRTGYFLDVFWSRCDKGVDKDEEYHDYLYHNMGTGVALTAAGSARELSRTLVGGKGYEYFTVEQALTGTAGLVADFDYGLKGIRTACHVATGPEDEVYAVKGPKAFRHYEGKVRNLPEPALVVRRKGAAWERPFVAVYEPYGNGVAAQVGSVAVRYGKTVEVTVTFKDRPDRRDVITVGGKEGLAVRSYRGKKLIDAYFACASADTGARPPL